MRGRLGDSWGWLVQVLLVVAASASVLAACGSRSPGTASGAPSVKATDMTLTAASSDQPNLPSAAVMDALEGRMAAMNEGNGAAAAAFYAPDGVLEETDLTPHLISRGRLELAARFHDLYDLGLRLAPAGAPIVNDRYVAEPVRFYHGSLPGRGAAMLVFEIDAHDQLAYQWMIGWAGGPGKTFGILKSPSVDEPNLPPRTIARILERRLAAMNRGDGRAAAAFYTRRGVLEEMDVSPSFKSRGRAAIAARLDKLYAMGLRLAPAGAMIAYDKYVAEPVYFFNADAPSEGARMLVFEFAPGNKIAHQYVIGWVD